MNKMFKILILASLFSISLANITNAIPLAIFVIGYEFMIMAIPTIISIFLTIYFYFDRWTSVINIYLLSLSLMLYGFFVLETKMNILFRYESIVFVLIMILMYFSGRFRVIRMSVLLSLIVIASLLLKADKDIYDYKDIYENAQKEIRSGYPKIEILGSVIKPNFLSINFFDKENKEIFYIVIRKDIIPGSPNHNGFSYSDSGVPEEMMDKGFIKKIIR